MKATTITDLHEHILFSIFCFLPAKFVIRCRCVCKEWSSLICQPNFPYEYFSRGKAPLQFVLEKDKNIVLAQIDEALLTSDFSVPANSIFDLGIRRILSFPSSFPINTSVDLHIVTCQVTGWILVVIYPRPDPLFDEGKQYDCHMYNPITGQHIVVQKPTGDHAGWGNISCALVLAQKTNQLKFLELCDGKANIQTIGTNAWRSHGEVHRCDGLPIVLNGRCHWLNNKARDIISFDAEEEVFQVIHTLSCFRDYKWCNLGLLDGCLCVSLISSNYVSEIWVMNEYGIRDSWTKKFGLLEPLACLKDSSMLLEPLACLKNGEILLLAGRTTSICYNLPNKTYSHMIVYNPHSRKYKYVEYSNSDECLEPIMGSSSVVDFKDYLGHCCRFLRLPRSRFG